MTKTEVEVTVRHRFPLLTEIESKILTEFALAVEYRLAQVRESFSEAQCLKSWEAYKLERSAVYNASAANAAKK